MEDFEFKPLTEGLGFHAKPQKNPQKNPQQNPEKRHFLSSTKTETVAPRTSSASAPSHALNLDTESDLLGRDTLVRETPRESTRDSERPISKSISDLIASLPPSLDFAEDTDKPSLSASESRPQIFQPFAR